MDRTRCGAPPPAAALLCGALLALGTAPAAAQEGPLVFIDPGHGGEQPGVVADGLEEKDLVLRLGFLVAEALAREGYETRMSRTGDEGPGFADRIAVAEAAGADLFLSLHINGDDDPAAWGTEIFLAEELPRSVEAAEAVRAALEETGARVTLIGQPWDVLKSESFPTVMLELGHLTHPVERRLMVSRAYHEEVAEALVTAVRQVVGPPQS